MTSQHAETDKCILISLYASRVSLLYTFVITLTSPKFLPCLGLTDGPSVLPSD